MFIQHLQKGPLLFLYGYMEADSTVGTNLKQDLISFLFCLNEAYLLLQ